MAKHDTDPVLQQLVNAVNESGQAGVPITVSVHGNVLTGVLIAQETYFAERAGGHPLMGALQPSSGLLGKEYAKEVTGEAGHHLHLRAAGSGDGLWRISVEAVDGWVLPVADADERDGKGPFARLLGT